MARLLLFAILLCLPSLALAGEDKSSTPSAPAAPAASAPAAPPAPAAKRAAIPPLPPAAEKLAKVDPALKKPLALYTAGRYAEAATMFEPLGRGGSLFAQYYLGEMLATGLGVKQDLPAAVEWLKGPAQAGLAPAQLVLAQALEASGPQQNLDAAAVFYRLASDHLPEARYRLGLMFMEGKGVKERPDLAYKLVETAANDGVAEAQLLYATMLRDGYGTEPNLMVAMDWFRSAAQKGMPSAQLVMSQAYGVGAGVPQNPALALDWAREAANQGNVDAQLLTGILLARGHGTDTDTDQAVFWLEAAAKRYVRVGSKNGAILVLVELEKIHPKSEMIPKLKAVISPDLE